MEEPGEQIKIALNLAKEQIRDEIVEQKRLVTKGTEQTYQRIGTIIGLERTLFILSKFIIEEEEEELSLDEIEEQAFYDIDSEPDNLDDEEWNTYMDMLEQRTEVDDAKHEDENEKENEDDK
jgi:hypothetical protein